MTSFERKVRDALHAMAENDDPVTSAAAHEAIKRLDVERVAEHQRVGDSVEVCVDALLEGGR